jgi:probable addiction module antidote protein
MCKSRAHADAKIESFRNNPSYAAEYLNAVLEDGDQEELLETLRYLVAASAGVSQRTEEINFNASTLYHSLSPTGNPELKKLTELLTAVGLRLVVQPLNLPHHSKPLL